VAFLAAANQLVPLVGHGGLLPADTYLERIANIFGSRTNGFIESPTLFWIGISDNGLRAVAWNRRGHFASRSVGLRQRAG